MKILLADGDTVPRDGIRSALDRLGGNITVLEATGDEDVSVQLGAGGLDIVLLGFAPGQPDRYHRMQTIRDRWPDTPVIVLTGSADPGEVKKVLELGAKGYVTCPDAGATLPEAIRLVLAGGTYLPLALFGGTDAGDLPRGPATGGEPGTHADDPGLTRRQLEILHHLVAGKTNREIGDALNITETTVKSHITTIFRSLDVSNRTQAVLRTIALGMFAGEED